MNKQSLTMFWDHFRQCHGIAMRVMEAWPADKLDSNPVNGMRTPKALTVHTYGLVKMIGEGVLKGEIPTPPDEKTVTATIKNRDDMLKFARDCWNAADKAVAQITDQHLQAIIKTPWNVEFPGHVCMMIANDEYMHHRGQMFTYLRVFGIEPPMMWDFENNAPEYRPKAQTQA